ncbi:MAG: NAD(P)-binding protein [Symploca sp. SIO2E9]|nr:NAD(P)-binding protein [Symploca sp. SIO2E9]
MSYNETKQFDVIILGSGIGGSILATILAKHKARVLIIDKGNHPRFAIGESITSHTEILLSLISHYYSVPELENLSSFQSISDNISASACGYKRSFGFLYHQEGKEQSPLERIQWGVSHSSHLFRQEIDHYLVKLAIKYGAKLLPETNIIDINIDENQVIIKTEAGEQFNSNYLVDASGHNSIIAKKLNLRENPPRFKNHSRSIFTHMVGVKPVDDCLQVNRENIMPWHQGTAHHVFDGGWMWVIPFNNHEKSTNPICSIGLNLDIRRFPKTEIPPEQEFENFISRFPSIATQFETAKPVRNWISTNQLQYSSHSCMGKRFFLLPHASGFVDPIFSPGLIQTFMSIIPLAALIMKAIASNDFSTKYFAPLERFQQDIFDYNDRIANCTYIVFTNFNLMNAWLRVWVLQHIISGSYKLFVGELLGLLITDYPEYKANVEFKIKDLSRLTEFDYLKNIDPRPQGWSRDFVEEAIAEVEKV